MRILFDQGTPVPLRNHLANHLVETALERGWSTLKNGELLAAAEDAFDLLITTDQKLRYQQNLTGKKLSILVLHDYELATPRKECFANHRGNRTNAAR